jgi:simple sugar transport system ATP-binding protein
VLRNGELVGEYEVELLPKVQLVAKMIGKVFDDLSNLYKDKEVTTHTDRKTNFISAKGIGHTGTIKPFDLDINKGEVLGLVGLLGSGRTETARVIFGIDKSDSGEMIIDGKKAMIASAADAMKHTIGFCPENRKTEGIIADLSVRENIILALQAKKGIGKYIKRKEQERIADEYIKILNIKTSGKEQLIKNLSGGNQQKVILARWLVTQPNLLILDEPTRGIDVGTKAEIQKLIVKLASEGIAVIFISSELDEILRCCHRLSVLRDGKKIAELIGRELDEKVVMHTIAGGEISAES